MRVPEQCEVKSKCERTESKSHTVTKAVEKIVKGREEEMRKKEQSRQKASGGKESSSRGPEELGKRKSTIAVAGGSGKVASSGAAKLTKENVAKGNFVPKKEQGGVN